MRKNIIALLLAVVMLFSLSLSALAYENDYVCVEEETAANTIYTDGGTRGTFSGYASKFVSASEQGSFTVTTTGLPLLSAGLTFKTSCDESDEPIAVISIRRPEGPYLLQDSAFGANEEVPFNFLLPTNGTYTIYYSVYVPSGATLQMQCWIYG